ncbi:ATP-grasp domain-containing protein [Sutcliffiella deserti]|uniref:ATP-grasp domain-containing protein n=1 Tax=Sutcliffiella deserti TaxID=2875501 RepID=UPI001CBE18C1|nr:ATP-grasp domain-containing protein [Sutcliffiella deserti]
MKRLLLLGGSAQQVTAIKYANKSGCYTILCDFLQDNPGQYIAHKYYCVSTTDKNAVLEIAIKEKIDAIVAYASDPAAPTAAYVSEKLGLLTNPYKSVETLAYKDKFREFLRINNFNCPRAQSFKNYLDVKEAIKDYKFPVMVKPVDSSGSKGVVRVESTEELKDAFILAIEQSRQRKVIIEEFIIRDHSYMIGGDCFVLNGKVEFMGLLNCHRNNKVNPLVPVGKSYPVQVSDERIAQINKEVQRVVDLLEIKLGGFNLEIIFDKQGSLHLIEMGPRNGGNMIPDLLKMITGVDLVAATIDAAIGLDTIELPHTNKQLYFATHNLHTSKSGIYKGIRINKEIENKIVKKVIYKKIGDTVQYFNAANNAIGIIFLKFESVEEMHNLMERTEQWINVIVE